MFVTVIVFLLILSFLVLIHEAGHFVVAKLFGIKVEEFGFGLPPRVFGIKKGETIYSINWLPIGGFVKLYGEDEAGAGRPKFKPQLSKAKVKDRNRAFFARPVWQRALVVFAGVFMNFMLAVVIISVLFSVVGVATPGDKVVVDNISKDSPAATSGLKKGDLLLSINGQKITSAQQVILYTRKHLGQKVAVQVKDNSKIENLTIVPRKRYPANEGPMGVEISQNIITQKYPWYKAPFTGTWEALKQTGLIISGLGMLFYQIFFRGSLPSDVAGPIGIAQLTGQFVQIGPSAVLSFISLLSLNLAIVNILPVPALDGGRLFFILLEGIFRRKVNQKIEGYAHAIGMAFLLGLILLITLHDIIRILTGQPLIPR